VSVNYSEKIDRMLNRSDFSLELKKSTTNNGALIFI